MTVDLDALLKVARDARRASTVEAYREFGHTFNSDTVIALIERCKKAEAILSQWLKSYDDTGEDNGPSIHERDCAEAARVYLGEKHD